MRYSPSLTLGIYCLVFVVTSEGRSIKAVTVTHSYVILVMKASELSMHVNNTNKWFLFMYSQQ